MKGVVFLLYCLPPFLARAGPKGLEGGMKRMWWVFFRRTQKTGMGPSLHVPEGKDIPFVQAQLR